MGLQMQHLEYNSELFKHYYLCNYRPQSTGLDQLSKSLINFKNGWPLDVEAWTDCSILELGKVPIEKGCLILRALNSTEESITLSSSTPLDKLGRKLANRFNAHYIPELLNKSRRTQKIKLLSAAEREVELSDVYTFKSIKSINNSKEIIILDDILTTGTTMREVIKAIRFVLRSCLIRIFTLASTDHYALLNESIRLKSYSYQWESKKGWNFVEEKKEPYLELSKLKSKILNNTFEDN